MKIEIQKPDTRLEALRFVAQAVAKEPSKYASTYLQINDGTIVGTDGHRLHIAYIDHAWEPGLYEVIKNTKTKVVLLKTDEQITFPKWLLIVPAYTSYFEVSDTYNGSFVVRTCGLLARHEIGIKDDYIKPLESVGYKWRVYFGDPTRPIKAITEANGKYLVAVIMPFNARYADTKTETRIISSIYVGPEAA
jgi:hypothetical protein